MHIVFTVIKYIVALSALVIAYFSFWPVPVEPVVWQAPESKGFTGDFSVNGRLEKFDELGMGDLHGPEAAIMLPNGDIIASSHEGWLVRFKPGAKVAEKWINVKGRPLGLDVDDYGNIWVANAYLGLQKVTPAGDLRLILDTVEDSPIGYADDVAVAVNGKIYFTDATMRFPAQDWGGTLPASVLDIVEHGDTGRVIEFDPVKNTARVVLSGLNFANGVAADTDEQFVLVNETGAYRVWKLWIGGARQGQSEVIVDNLPGFPDNIARGQNGVFWLGIVGPRSADIDKYDDNPFWRKVMIRLPESMRPSPEPYGMVVGINSEGQVLHNLQAPSGKLYTTTGLVETDSDLYVTSLTAPFLARVNKADAGLQDSEDR